jgi:hypothetical protein
MITFHTYLVSNAPLVRVCGYSQSTHRPKPASNTLTNPTFAIVRPAPLDPLVPLPLPLPLCVPLSVPFPLAPLPDEVDVLLEHTEPLLALVMKTLGFPPSTVAAKLPEPSVVNSSHVRASVTAVLGDQEEAEEGMVTEVEAAVEPVLDRSEIRGGLEMRMDEVEGEETFIYHVD